MVRNLARFHVVNIILAVIVSSFMEPAKVCYKWEILEFHRMFKEVAFLSETDSSKKII